MIDLQGAVFQALVADSALTALVDGVFDEAPEELALGTWVLIGEGRVTDRSSATHRGSRHELTVEIASVERGFGPAKAVAATVADALVDRALPLASGSLVGLTFLRARLVRGKPPVRRRVVLTFRALVDETPLAA